MGKRRNLFCFSPPVMLVTFIIEFALVAYVVARYRLDPVGRLVAAILLLLGAFQVVEYVVCVASNDPFWGALGYGVITLLPPLGLDLARRLVGLRRDLAMFGYVLASAWLAVLAASPEVVASVGCSDNYSILSLEQPFGNFYQAYYLGLLALGLTVSLMAARRAQPPQSRAGIWLAIGYLSFTVPALVIYLAVERTGFGIPSIMCGFAVLLALILTFRVLPLAGQRRRPPN